MSGEAVPRRAPAVVWRYKVVMINRRDGASELADTLNRLGGDGWEAVGPVGVFLVLKQPEPAE